MVSGPKERKQWRRKRWETLLMWRMQWSTQFKIIVMTKILRNLNPSEALPEMTAADSGEREEPKARRVQRDPNSIKRTPTKVQP